jgi:hypothetical protein
MQRGRNADRSVPQRRKTWEALEPWMGGKRGHITAGNTMLPRVFQVRNA